jgi:hypothetical protein
MTIVRICHDYVIIRDGIHQANREAAATMSGVHILLEDLGR